MSTIYCDKERAFLVELSRLVASNHNNYNGLVSNSAVTKNIIVKGAAILMVANLCSRLLGYVREKAIAHYFGDNWYSDAWVSAFELPDNIYYLLAGGALGAALIPVVRAYFHREDVEGGHRIANSVLNLMLLAMVAAGALAVIFAPLLVRLIAPGYTPGLDPRYDLTVALTRVLMPQVALMGISAVFTALLQCHDHFTWPAVGWLLYNVGIIIGTVFLAPILGGPPEHQIYGPVLGVLLGAVMLVAIQLPALRAAGYRWAPIASLQNPDLRRLLRTWLPIVAALAISQVSLLSLPKWLGSYFSEGMVMNMRLAQRLILVPYSLFGVSIAVAAFPTMSTQAFAGRLEEMRGTLSRGLSSTLYFVLPSTVGIIVLALPVTRLLWRSGEYSEAAAQANAQMLALFALGLAGICAVQIINRAFFALKEIRLPLLVGGGAFGLNLALSVGLMRTELGYRGIIIGIAAAFSLAAVVLLELLRRRLGGVNGPAILNSFLRSLLAALLMGLFILVILQVVEGSLARGALGGVVGGLARLGIPAYLVAAGLKVAAGVFIGGACYLIITLAMRVPEASSVARRIARRLHLTRP